MTDGTNQHETESVGKRGLEIDWIKTAAGALAAVASAFLLSFLGAAGTIIGAALGSLIVTISSAVFTEGLSTSKRTLEKAQAKATRKVGVAQAEVRRAEQEPHTAAHDSHLEHADQRLAQAQRDLYAVNHGDGKLSWRERLRLLPWKRVLVGAGLLFVASIVLITAIELATGRSVASITGGSGGGGTTIGDVGDRGSSNNDDDKDRQDPGRETPSPSPSDDSSPSDQTSPSGSVEPTPSPSESPSVSPHDGVTQTPTPTPEGREFVPEAPTSATP